MPVREGLNSSSYPVISILPLALFDLRPVVPLLKLQPFSFISLRFFSFLWLCQEYATCLPCLQIPPSSPGSIFSLERIWRERWGSIWQVDERRRQTRTFGTERSGFDPTRLWWNGKRGLENWNVLMWEVLCLCHCGIPRDNTCRCEYSSRIWFAPLFIEQTNMPASSVCWCLCVYRFTVQLFSTPIYEIPIKHLCHINTRHVQHITKH